MAAASLMKGVIEMDTDQTVDNKTIRLVQKMVRTLGCNHVGERWAESETDLYVHMLAGVARIEEYVERQHVSPETIPILRKEILTLLLECAEALRRSNNKLWADFLPDDEPTLEGGAS
jgi:uncharacterized short protein YbdD (DUF466 family)